MNARHLRELVIGPTLRHLQLWSLAAEELVLGTAAQESHCGEYLKQLGTGPALGIYQVEPATHNDVWDNFLRYRPELRDRVVSLLARVDLALPLAAAPPDRPVHQLVWNLAYSTAIARLQYLRDKRSLPAAGDIPGQAATWKRVYNTEKGKGTVEEYLANWRKYVAA